MSKPYTASAASRLAGCHKNTLLNYVSRGLVQPFILSDGTRCFDAADIQKARELVAEARRGRPRKEQP